MKMVSIFRPLRRDRPWRGVAAGAVLFGLAVAARWKLGGLTEGFGPMLLLPAILLAGTLGGTRVGLGMAGISLLIAWTWFFPPYGTFALEPSYMATVVAFILTALVELYVVRVLNLTINDLATSEERSVTMFRELQHRVANNLQIVSAVLRQDRKKLDRDNDAVKVLEKASQRLDLMVHVHRSLNNPNIVDLPLSSYLQGVGDDLIAASNTPHVQLTVTAAPITLDVERLMSLSMIVAETITNALKHAFHGRQDGRISVTFSAVGRDYVLLVHDDGPGFPSSGVKTNRRSLGRGIIESLASQLRGKLSLESGPGARVRVEFPI